MIDLATYTLMAAGALIGAGITLITIALVIWITLKLTEGK